jgi:transposase
MSLKPMEIPPVPEETARVARAAFPKGTPFLRFRDELGVIYRDEMFASLFPKRGQPATVPWRLALVSASSTSKACPTGRRPRRSAVGSIGNMVSAWNWRIRGSTSRC